MAEYPEVGMRLHAMYKGDGNYSPATVASLALDAWVSVNLLKSKALPKKPEKPPKAAVKKKLAPKAKANSAKPKPMDCSRAKKGMRVQDGKYWAAPIKVTFMGYDKQYDEWLGADRLHSKAIVPCKEKDAKDLGATKTAANSIKAAPDKTIKDLGASLLATAASAVPEPGVAPAVEVPGVTMQEELGQREDTSEPKGVEAEEYLPTLLTPVIREFVADGNQSFLELPRMGEGARRSGSFTAGYGVAATAAPSMDLAMRMAAYWWRAATMATPPTTATTMWDVWVLEEVVGPSCGQPPQLDSFR
ncbi:SPAC4G8.04 [Symbiodinium natans]|uniref:SPAC4G8.04 protein n=1 Tax=Symbiodinium natans TaxID=878477 RepID=A0A812TJ35_9DINO|nr:SPAC4G8.04 [Symbiodinium natans]